MSTELIATIISSVGALVLEYLRRQKVSGIREWRENVLPPFITESWYQMGDEDRSLESIQQVGIDMAKRSNYRGVRSLSAKIVRDMVTVALGTVPGIGRSGAYHTRRNQT